MLANQTQTQTQKGVFGDSKKRSLPLLDYSGLKNFSPPKYPLNKDLEVSSALSPQSKGTLLIKSQYTSQIRPQSKGESEDKLFASKVTFAADSNTFIKPSKEFAIKEDQQ